MLRFGEKFENGNNAVKLSTDDVNWLNSIKKKMNKLLSKKGYTFGPALQESKIKVKDIKEVCDMANLIIDEYNVNKNPMEAIYINDPSNIMPLKRLNFLEFIRDDDEEKKSTSDDQKRHDEEVEQMRKQMEEENKIQEKILKEKEEKKKKSENSTPVKETNDAKPKEQPKTEKKSQKKKEYVESESKQFKQPKNHTYRDDCDVYSALSAIGIPIGLNICIKKRTDIVDNSLYTVFADGNYLCDIEPKSGPFHGRLGGSVLIPYRHPDGRILYGWVSLKETKLLREHFKNPSRVVLTKDKIDKCNCFWSEYLFGTIKPNRWAFEKIARSMNDEEYKQLGCNIESAIKYLSGKYGAGKYRIVSLDNKDNFVIASDKYAVLNQNDQFNNSYLVWNNGERKYGRVVDGKDDRKDNTSGGCNNFVYDPFTYEWKHQ